METYIITSEEKQQFLLQYPIFECPNSIGINYGDYISVKCTALTGTCTYASAQKNEYLNCKFISSKSQK